MSEMDAFFHFGQAINRKIQAIDLSGWRMHRFQ